MRSVLVKTLYALVLCILTCHTSNAQREITELQNGWKFNLGHHENASRENFDDVGWKDVVIPHDWGVDGGFVVDGDGNTGKLPWKGEGWYRKTLDIPSSYSGKQVYLLFEGIMAFPTVYMNGQQAGKWDYGYNSFYLDITDKVRVGTNTLAVHVDTRQHDSRWYPGAGIYRKVQLIAVNPVHVDIWGTYITTPVVKPHYADVRVATTIASNGPSTLRQAQGKPSSGTAIIIKHTILTSDKKNVVEQESTIHPSTSSGSGQSQLTETTLTIPNPRKWDIDSPHLYTMITELYQNDTLIDTYTSTFGVRSIRFTANDGFYLNDRRVQLKGVNLHHDLGPLGTAFNRRAMQRQLEIMKSMGCNAVRTSHNVPAPELLDLCDEMGILVFNEIFDKYDGKADITDTTDFDAFAHRNIRNFVMRDRNHPSIFLWSVGNEIGDVQWNKNGGFQKLRTMLNYLEKYDDSRPITLVCDSYGSAELRHFDYYDVHCWNYGRRYALARQLEPTKSVIISESASTLSTRGFYELPLPEKKTDFTKSLQVSSYDLNAPDWAEVADDDFMWQQEEPYIAGEFVWTGFDYIGEPTPYENRGVKALGMTDMEASRSSYFGIVDLCGIPKDRYYLYKSYWKPDETTVHILPHWNWPDKLGQNVPVFVYTNGDCAELFLNGMSLGMKCKQPKSKKSIERFRLMWNDVVYEHGELKAIAYREGEKIGEQIVRTAGKPTQLRLTPDRTTIQATGKDLAFILVEALDKDGNICPLADNTIEIKLSGDGTIAGVDNGNPQSFDAFKSNTVKLFYGKAMMIMGSRFTKGEISIEVSSKGLQSVSKSVKME